MLLHCLIAAHRSALKRGLTGPAAITCCCQLPNPTHRAQHSVAAGTHDDDNERAVLALLKEELAALSIPAAELTQFARRGLSDAALTAWALTKTTVHPAADQAAAATQRLQYLLTKLDGAMMRQHAASSSPIAEVLWQVAVAAVQQQVRGLSEDERGSCVEYMVAQATIRAQRSTAETADALELLEQQLPQFVDMSPHNALLQPAFWQLARAAAAEHSGLVQDLALLGYDLDAACAASDAQLQVVQQHLGLDAGKLQQQLVDALQGSANLLLPDQHSQLIHTVSGNAAARPLLAQLQLLETLAAALGMSSVQLSRAPSSIELMKRLTGRGAAAPPISQHLAEALQAAAPALLAAVSQLPAQQLAASSVAGLLQLLSSQTELQGLSQSLGAWRAAAAAAGSLPVLASLSRSEVSALSKGQAEAVGRAVMGLEAQGRLLLQQAAAGQLDLVGLTSAEADALAWKVHNGGTQAAEELVQLVLAQASHVASALEAEGIAADEALTALSVGFELEEATSRRSTGAPPSSYVMSGIPQLQVEELAAAVQPAGGELVDSSSSSRDSNTSSTSQLNAAERLVRDLAVLLSDTDNSSSSAGSYQAAAQRLHVLAHDLPRVLSGPLLDLLETFQPTAAAASGGVWRQQQLLQAFLQVVAAELPQQLDLTDSATGSSSSSSAFSARASGARGAAAAEGLLQLLGAQDCGEVLAHAAAKRAESKARSDAAAERADGQEEAGHLHDWLARVHHDQDMQRYLQIEFEPALDVDVVHTPRAWRDTDLFISAPEFLNTMRPLLDSYLAAQGERVLQDLEWQVYRDAALAETEQVEAEVARRRHAAGHSPFHNSRADEAFLRERLDAGIPQDSVLYAAAHKYLSASFRNRTWRFAQRKRMVDTLVHIADHLAAHPPRSHRGSPFSALFQQQGPPMVPRISGQPDVPGAADSEVYTLPAGFGAGTASAAVQ